jgi:TPR repeat protein
MTPSFGPATAAESPAFQDKPTTVAMAQPDFDDLMRRAQTLEQTGNYRDALAAYKTAGQAGHGPASKRAAELYIKNAPGIPRDYLSSVRWFSMARAQGVEVDAMEKRF